MSVNQKLNKLRSVLQEIDSAVVAFSGGVDSTFLAKVANETISGKVLAVTMVSAFLPKFERQSAKRLADQMNIRHEFLQQKLGPALRHNPTNRCYHCKKEVYSRLLSRARQKGLSAVLDGSNADDVRDYRPGRKALQEMNIRSPLQEAGLTKKEIRQLSKRLGLENWNKPAMACLGSRFIYGETFTPKKLQMVEAAEEVLRDFNLAQWRVRHHGDLCRIEIRAQDFPRMIKNRERIAKRIKDVGYKYVTLDIEGYRTGSMNETIAWKKKK